MLACVLLALGCQPALVTFSHPCASSSTVLAALGESLGLDLRASGSVTQDWIVVRADSQPLDSVLDRIAATLDATWTEKDGVRYLGRTGLQENRITTYGQDVIRVAVEKHTTTTPAARTWTRDEAKALLRPFIKADGSLDADGANERLQERGPYRDLLEEFVRGIGASELAKLPLLKYIKYQWDQGADRRRLSPSFRQTALAIARSVNAFGDAFRELGVRAPIGYGARSPDSWSFGAQSFGRSVSVFVTLTNGQPVASFSIDVRVPPALFEQLPGLDAEYSPSPFAKSVIEALRKSTSFGGEWQSDPTKVDPTVVKWFEDSFPVDPLHVLGGEALLQAAEAAKLNVVAVLPDGLADGIAVYRANEGRPLSALLHALLGMHVVEIEDGWLMARHSLDLGARERFDRAAVAAYALQTRHDGRQRIDPLANLASNCDGSQALWHALALADVINPTKARFRMVQDHRFALLNIYASLPAGAKERAKNGGVSWPLHEVPAQARARLLPTLANGHFKLAAEPQPHDLEWSSDHLWQTPALQGEVPPNLDGAAVEVRLDAAKRLVTPDAGGEGLYPSRLFSAAEAAQRIMWFRQSPPPLLPDGRRSQGYDHLAVVDAERLLVTVRTRDGSAYEIGLIVDSQGTDTKYHPYNAVPGSEGEALREALKKLGG